MDITPVLLGAGMAGFGLYGLTLYLLGKAEQTFKKLGPMRQTWGPAAGTAIHVSAYVILPIVAGVIFLVVGLSGQSIF